MAGILSRSVEWLVGFAREVDRGIAIGRGYEAPERKARTRCSFPRAIQGEGRRRHEDKGSRGHW
ncbi:MAG: hypothetical protein ACR2JR_09650 [Rubrobacteraceae bacterium]